MQPHYRDLFGKNNISNSLKTCNFKLDILIMTLGYQDKDAGNKFMHKRSCGLSHCQSVGQHGIPEIREPLEQGASATPGVFYLQ